ncbi:hypothetical protein F4802DRAFT_561798 [Xylaria palmicola]|nr:hypothetical protein F4802DRAFT_561798 [Xylaria palmicola]
MDKKKRIVFHLDTPYSSVSWPQIPPTDQDTILDLLCGLLSPLGQYRSRYTPASKGQRAKKRKRRQQPDQDIPQEAPPVPELQAYVDIGLSCVSRALQKTASEGAVGGPQEDGRTPEDPAAGRPYSAIFVARSGQPNALSSHLPQMVAVASKSHPSQPPTRLVELPRACEARLSESLGIPRVSCVGIRVGAPNSSALVDFTRGHVAAAEIPWLQEASLAEYRPTRINATETVVGARRKKKGKSAS